MHWRLSLTGASFGFQAAAVLMSMTRRRAGCRPGPLTASSRHFDRQEGLIGPQLALSADTIRILPSLKVGHKPSQVKIRVYSYKTLMQAILQQK